MMAPMSRLIHRPADAGDAATIADLVIAYEESVYGESTYARSDLESEWEDLDLARDSLVFVDGAGIVAYGSLDDRGALWRAEGYVHPASHGRGVGTELVKSLEAAAASRGARRMQNGVAEPDEAGRQLFADLGYRPVRVFREMRIE